MNVGSLFSGAGLMDWGLTLAGFEYAWFCESDPYCRRILERRWPGVPVYDDVRTLTGAAPVDILSGGFPCQPFSAAGKRAGTDDDRWLWPHFARTVSELRPRYVLVENVPGLLAGRGMGGVLGDLAALGYDAEWDCLPASAFGAPHRRDRVFLLAYPERERRHGRPRLGGRSDPDRPTSERRESAGIAEGCGSATGALGDTEGDGRGSRRPRGSSSASAGQPQPVRSLQDADRRAVQSRRIRWGTSKAGSAEWWAAEPDVGRVANGVPARLDRLAAIGNGVVPQVAQWIGERIAEAEQMRAAA